MAFNDNEDELEESNYVERMETFPPFNIVIH